MKNKRDRNPNIQDTTFSHFEKSNSRHTKPGYHIDGALPNSPVEVFKHNCADGLDGDSWEGAKPIEKSDYAKRIDNILALKEGNTPKSQSNEVPYNSLNDVERACGVEITPLIYISRMPSKDNKRHQSSLDLFL